MTERVIAIARLAVTLVCMVASLIGVSIDPDSLFTVVMVVLAFASMVYAWYKNANLTDAAQQAQHYLDAIKKMADGDGGSDDGEEEPETD